MTAEALDVCRETVAESLAIETLTAAPWAIHEAALPLRLPAVDSEQAAPANGDGTPRGGAVGVIRASGIVLPRCSSILERYGYAISCEGLAARIEAFHAEGCAAVAVLFHSPGGSALGVPEAAKRIAAVAKQIPVVAVADYFAASGAYWLAAPMTAFVASPSAQVGSIGVFSVRVGITRMLDADGVDVDVFYRGEGKLDYAPFVEIDAAARKRMQAGVDAVYDAFCRDVAAGRGVARKVVADRWGAQVLHAAPAKAAGMIDAVATASDVIDHLATSAGRRRYRQLGARRRIVHAVREQLARPSGGKS